MNKAKAKINVELSQDGYAEVSMNGSERDLVATILTAITDTTDPNSAQIRKVILNSVAYAAADNEDYLYELINMIDIIIEAQKHKAQIFSIGGEA